MKSGRKQKPVPLPFSSISLHIHENNIEKEASKPHSLKKEAVYYLKLFAGILSAFEGII